MQTNRMAIFSARTAAAVCLVGLMGWTFLGMARGEPGSTSPDSPIELAIQQESEAEEKQESTGGDLAATDPTATPDGVGPVDRVARDPKSYEYLVFAPALIAIVFAIFTRQIVPALVVGVFVGAYMMAPCLPADHPYADTSPILAGLRLAAEQYILGGFLSPDNDFGRAKVIMFTLMIGFTVGAIARNGGTAGMVRLVTGGTTSARRGGITAWLAGMVVFFDDYANAMIVGPTMGPVFDRLKISRAKLAYIVDSTAAPVASIALIGTWIGTEISYIQKGLNELAAAGGGPEFLSGVTGMSAFIYSLPYRFYPVLALVLVFLLAATERDFGPMRRAQRRAALGETGANPAAGAVTPSDSAPPRWWLGFFPILMLIIVTVAVLGVTGYRAMGPEEWDKTSQWWAKAGLLIGNADAYLSIFYGALFAALTAVVLTVFARACSTKHAVDSGLEGMARMFPAIVILILAWAISDVSQALKLGEVSSDYLIQANFAPQWLPLAVFVASAVISFATGTSWTTMAILCPVTVLIAAGLIRDLPVETALPLFYSAVGSVLAGSIFGDHCSPISDTTVLSSIASGCAHEEHVITQLPYAMVVAFVSMALGNVMRDVYGKPWWMSMIAGAVVLVLIVFIFGRRQPRISNEPPGMATILPAPNAKIGN